MEVIILMAWSICSVRNDTIFQQGRPSSQKCIEIFRQEFAN
jgi:hypothetical protein